MDNQKNFLNIKLWEQFHNFFNSEPIKSIVYENERLFLFVCSFLSQTKINISVLNKKVDNEIDFYNFILHSSMLKESIEKLEEEIKEIDKLFKIEKVENKELFYEDWKQFWIDTQIIPDNKFNKEMENSLRNDDNFFKYIRSLCCAHPLNTTRHPTKIKNQPNNFLEYVKKQCLYSIDIGGLACAISNFKNYHDVQISIHLLHDKSKARSAFLNIKLSNLKIYISNYYSYIEQIFTWFKNRLNEFYKKEKEKKYIWSDNNSEFLDYLIRSLEEKYLSADDLKLFKSWYDVFNENKIIYKENNENIQDYFDYVINYIRNNIIHMIENFDENYDYEDNSIEQEIFNCCHQQNKVIVDNFNYEIEKLSYLKGERNGAMPKNDELCNQKEYGLYQAYVLYKKFASKYITMDLYNPELSFAEIRLLIAVALFMHNKK